MEGLVFGYDEGAVVVLLLFMNKIILLYDYRLSYLLVEGDGLEGLAVLAEGGWGELAVQLAGRRLFGLGFNLGHYLSEVVVVLTRNYGLLGL